MISAVPSGRGRNNAIVRSLEMSSDDSESEELDDSAGSTSDLEGGRGGVKGEEAAAAEVEGEGASRGAAAVMDRGVCDIEGDAEGRELGGVTRGLLGSLVFPMTSQGWFTSISTDRPSIKSCLELATTRLLS
jgi:hypothetical protein